MPATDTGKNITKALAFTFLLLVIPNVAAVDLSSLTSSEGSSTDTCANDCPYYEYIAGPGLVVDQTGALLTTCPEGCDVDGDGRDESPPVGMVLIQGGSAYSNVLVSATDDLWGSNTAMRACLLDESGTCPTDGASDTGWSCGGTTAVLDSPFASDTLAVFIVTLRVTADLEVCGGTTGMVSPNWF